MNGKFLGKLVILLTSYLLICAIIYFISFFSLTKKIFIDLPGFRAIQKSLYYGPYLEVWQNKSECVVFDEKLIYVPKVGSCKHSNAEFQTILNFNEKGRVAPNAPNKSQKPIMYIMNGFFILLFNSFPAGLNLYYTAYNVLSFLQQRKIKAQHSI